MSAWLALVLTDAIAVVTFARCFTGPGELTAALAGLVLAHLSGLAARGGLSTIRADDLIEPGRAGGSSSGSGTAQGFHDRRQRGLRSGWWALGLVLAVFVPIGIVLGPSSLWVAPHGT